jgi:hypothetical protein
MTTRDKLLTIRDVLVFFAIIALGLFIVGQP